MYNFINLYYVSFHLTILFLKKQNNNIKLPQTIWPFLIRKVAHPYDYPFLNTFILENGLAFIFHRCTLEYSIPHIQVWHW